MSNYPDDVTGNEPAIAGYDESELAVQCNHETETIPVHFAEAMLASARAGSDLLGLMDDIAGVVSARGTTEFCGFDATVDVVWTGRVVAQWVCPWCGTEHETEVDDDRDPEMEYNDD